MSEWTVQLVFSEGSSNKFWRARTDGSRLVVNYGRIGADGQQNIKDFPSPEECEKELEKLARSKRNKGYLDDPNAVPAEPEPPPPVTSGPAQVSMALELEGRRIELTMARDGTTVRTEVVERYENESGAESAFARICEAMEAEGYRRIAR